MKLACGRCWDRDCKCSAQELKEYNSVKEKMYSRDEKGSDYDIDVNRYMGIQPFDPFLGNVVKIPSIGTDEFAMMMGELVAFSDITKKRYFELKRLYNSSDSESVCMAAKIVVELHKKMLLE